jgi:hypothetical protein
MSPVSREPGPSRTAGFSAARPEAQVTAARGRPRVSLTPDQASVPNFLSYLRLLERLRACQEANPTGYNLHSTLAAMRISCQATAPSLVPRASDDKVNTDGPYAALPPPLPFRCNDLVALGCRSHGREKPLPREANMLEHLTTARNRLGEFLLRPSHGRHRQTGQRRRAGAQDPWPRPAIASPSRPSGRARPGAPLSPEPPYGGSNPLFLARRRARVLTLTRGSPTLRFGRVSRRRSQQAIPTSTVR